MTLKELAELSGFSIGTISKAFSGSNEISEKTRTKIFEIAKSSNCFDSLNTRSYPGKIIGVIVPNYNEYADFINCIDKTIKFGKAIPMFMFGNTSKKAETELVDICIRYKKTDGVIVVNPLVTYTAETIVGINVETRDTSSLSEAIALLKQNGHIRISYIGTSSGKYNSSAFKTALAENAIHSGGNYFAESDNNSEVSGYETMEYLFGMPFLPTAVITESDSMSIGAEKYITKRGMKIPRDISVVSLESVTKNNNLSTICKNTVNQLLSNKTKKYR